MSISEIVRADFEEFIRMDPSVPNELRTSLKIKERLPVFLDKLTGQILDIYRVKPHIKLDRLKIKNLVYDMTRMYVHLLKKQVDEMHMSDVAKEAMRIKIEGDDIAKKLDKDGNADLTEELGVIIKDKDNGGETNKV